MFVLIIAVDTHAATKINAEFVSCGSLRAAIGQSGAAIVNYQPTPATKLPVFDRFVRNSQFCSGDEAVETDFVRTRDTSSCPVSRCVPTDCGQSNR